MAAGAIDPATGNELSPTIPLAGGGWAQAVVFVNRWLALEGGPVDCAAVGCTVSMTQRDIDPGHPVTNAFPLTFRPEWTPWPTVSAFLTEVVEAVRGAPLGPARRIELAAALADRSVLAPDLIVRTALDAPPSDATIGAVTRLYLAFLGRPPDSRGLEHWDHRLRRGDTLESVARAFGGTAEVRSRYAGLTDAQAVDRAYGDTFDRAPDPGGRTYWVERLRRGLSRTGMILAFSRTAEMRRVHADDVGASVIWWGLFSGAPPAADAGRPLRDRVVELLASPQVP